MNQENSRKRVLPFLISFIPRRKNLLSHSNRIWDAYMQIYISLEKLVGDVQNHIHLVLFKKFMYVSSGQIADFISYV